MFDMTTENSLPPRSLRQKPLSLHYMGYFPPVIKVTCYYRFICTVFATSLSEGGLRYFIAYQNFCQSGKQWISLPP